MVKLEYRLWFPYIGQNVDRCHLIVADSHEDAVEEWVEKYYSHSLDYAILDGEDFKICVMVNSDNSEVKMVNLSTFINNTTGD